MTVHEAGRADGSIDAPHDEQATAALRLIATVLGHDPVPPSEDALSLRERVVLTIACDALGLDDPVF